MDGAGNLIPHLRSCWATITFASGIKHTYEGRSQGNGQYSVDLTESPTQEVWHVASHEGTTTTSSIGKPEKGKK